MKKTIINGLLKYNRKSLQGLHSAFGFDFEDKSIQLYAFKGSFTINSLKKAYGIDPTQQRVVILMEGNKTWTKRLRVVMMEGEKIKLDNFPGTHRYIDGFDAFIFKSDYEELRKLKDTYKIVIVQEKTNIKLTRKKTLIGFERVGFKKAYRCTSVNGKNYIYRLLVKNGNSEELHEVPRISNDLSQVIDKSGYLIYYYRHSLDQRLEIYKHDNDVKKAATYDLNGELLNIKRRIHEVHNLIISVLSKSLNEKIYDTLRSEFYNLSIIAWRFERLNGSKVIGYNSQSASVKTINESIDKILKNLEVLKHA